MSFFQKLFGSAPPPAPPPAAPPPKAPDWLLVDGEWVDLNTLTPAQLVALEALLTQQRQQREGEFAEHLRRLVAERERLLEGADFRLWLMALQMLFGEDLGKRVAVQDIGPGMQLQHLIIGLGQPDAVTATAGGVALRYGPPGAGSYFEVQGDTITHAAILAVPPLPLSA